MKKMRTAALALILLLGSALRNDVSAQYYDGYDDRDRDVTYQDFYDDLSPYGRWVEYPGQGYVWVPDAEPDFQPYSTRGHWVWTDDYEWMWVSEYDWGWAPFHYGRWDYDNYYGWYWVPGYEWSPAWVAWRDGGDYYGWAPIRPGISISINFNIGGYSPPYNFWCFAPRRYITSPRIYDYYLDRRQNVTIINQTTIIVNNFRYGGSYGFRSGPRRYDAEIYCGRINPVRFRQMNTPGRTLYRNNEVGMYRPTVRQDNNRSFAPRQFERYDRNSGGFRNNNGYGRDNGGNNDFRRDNSINNRRPDPRDRVENNRSFDRRMNNPGRSREENGGFRRDDNRPQPNSDPNRTNDRRFERNDNGPGRQPMERRMERPDNRPDRTYEPRDNRPTREPSAQPGNGRFDRGNREVNPGGNREMRMEQPSRPPQTERRQEPPQRSFERRPESRPQPQMERQQPQQPQRSFERRSDEGGGRQRDAGNNGGGNGGGNGRGRRF